MPISLYGNAARCPDLILVPVRFPAYRAASAIVKGILAQYDPNFEFVVIGNYIITLTRQSRATSLDEAYMDITEYIRSLTASCSHGEAINTIQASLAADVSQDALTRMTPLSDTATLCEWVVWKMRAQIIDKTKLTASAGIASLRRLSKVCSGDHVLIMYSYAGTDEWW